MNIKILHYEALLKPQNQKFVFWKPAFTILHKHLQMGEGGGGCESVSLFNIPWSKVTFLRIML